MPIKITMPALSPTMEEGNLAKWNVKEGDKVTSGDILAEIETDKATMEVEAIDDGTVAKIIVADGTSGVKVNALIAVLAEEGEKLDEAVQAATQDQQSSSSPAQGESATQQKTSPQSSVEDKSHAPAQKEASEAGQAADSRRLFASPLARRMAKQANIDLAAITGSGPHGRIIKSDVEAFSTDGDAQSSISSAALAPSESQVLKLFNEGEYEIEPHDSMRKAIAKRLVESKQTIPHFYVTIDCELDNLLKLRADLNAAAPLIQVDDSQKPAYKLSVNDMVIKATALALKAIPDANVSWLDSGMIRHKHVDVGVAVSLPNGLITPIVRHADEKSLVTISNEMKDLAKRARDRKLAPQEYQGGSTAVSNMGMFGVKEFSAIINPPQATIFAVGAGEKRAVVKDGALSVATVMSVTVSTDHRAVDGALAAKLLHTFKQRIENPVSMLL